MALAQLRINIGHTLPHALPQAHEVVIDPDQQQRESDRDYQHRRSPERVENINHDATTPKSGPDHSGESLRECQTQLR